MSKAVNSAYRMPYLDYHPFWDNDSDDGILTFANGGFNTLYYNEWVVPKSCYDAVQSMRFSQVQKS